MHVQPTPPDTPPATPINATRKILTALIGAALVVLVMAPRHAGFMLYIVVLAMVFWLPYSAYVIVRRPQYRRLQIALVAIWLVAVALVAGIHYVRHQTTRRDAQEIAIAIQSFIATRGRCPTSLEEIGISQRQLSDKLGISSYQCVDGKPSFFYSATYIVFDIYDYDFNTGSWVYRPD